MLEWLKALFREKPTAVDFTESDAKDQADRVDAAVNQTLNTLNRDIEDAKKKWGDR